MMPWHRDLVDLIGSTNESGNQSVDRSSSQRTQGTEAVALAWTRGSFVGQRSLPSTHPSCTSLTLCSSSERPLEGLLVGTGIDWASPIRSIRWIEQRQPRPTCTAVWLDSIRFHSQPKHPQSSPTSDSDDHHITMQQAQARPHTLMRASTAAGRHHHQHHRQQQASPAVAFLRTSSLPAGRPSSSV